MAERNRDDAFMRINRGEHDRYRRTRVYDDETIIAGTRRYGVWRSPRFNVEDVKRHTVTAKDVGHMDLIAKVYYDDETLWWVIAWANRVKNTITDMYIGQQLAIPDLAAIAGAIDEVI